MGFASSGRQWTAIGRNQAGSTAGRAGVCESEKCSEQRAPVARVAANVGVDDEGAPRVVQVLDGLTRQWIVG